MPVTISGTGSITGAGLNKRIAAFTASGTWTVPAGVTYAIAHVLGGGGGLGTSGGAGTAGTDSSVAFAGGTITATGGPAGPASSQVSTVHNAPANSGKGGIGQNNLGNIEGYDGNLIVAGDSVTPGASITVTVGNGGTGAGTGSTGSGGSGYVYIEYYDG